MPDEEFVGDEELDENGLPKGVPVDEDEDGDDVEDEA